MTADTDKPECDVDFKALAAKFDPRELEWRILECGKDKEGKPWAIICPYVTVRAVEDRLDETVGPHRWQNTFAPGPAGGVICTISIKINGEWISKSDGAENTDIEAVKGGLSSAMKRAAAQWQIGRYLYALPTMRAAINPRGGGDFYCKGKKDKGVDSFTWNPPILPQWALPDGYKYGAQPDNGRQSDEPPADEAPKPAPAKPKTNGKKPPAGDRPGSDLSAYAKASAALANAMTPNDLARYIKAIEQRTENGEYTADEFKKLEAEADARMRQLSGRETATAQNHDHGRRLSEDALQLKTKADATSAQDGHQAWQAYAPQA